MTSTLRATSAAAAPDPTSTSASVARPFMFAAVGVVMSVLLLAAIAPTMPNPAHGYATLVYALFMLSNAALFFQVGMARPKIAAAIFWTFFSYMVFLPGYFQIHYGFYWLDEAPAHSNSIILLTATMSLAGIVSVAVGQAIYDLRQLARPVAATRRAVPLTTTPVLLCAAAFIVLAFALALVIDIDYYFRARYEYYALRAREQTDVYNLVILLIPRVLGAFGLFMFALYVVNNWSNHRRINYFWLAIGIPIGLFTAYVFINPVSVARYWFFGLSLSIFFFVFGLHRFIYRALFFASFVIAFCLLMPLVDVFARRFSSIDKLADAGFFGGLREYMLSGDLNQYPMMMNAVYYVQQQGTEHGRQLLSAILFFVPRSIWPGKGEPSGGLAGEVAGYKFLNLSMPIFGELYIDGNVVGVIVGGILLGYFLSWIDRRLERCFIERDLFTRLWICTFIGFSLMLYRGALLGVVGGISFFIILYLPLSFVFVRYELLGRAGDERPAGATRREPSPLPAGKPVAARWIARRNQAAARRQAIAQH